jgi:hypothetical protein|tara:strand:+ start:1342 stop:1605 length:264 start_codon:yes stop_codon:yes gene_type:complete
MTLDIDERQNYDKMFETFNTEGWSLIQARFAEMFNQGNNIFTIPDEKTFWQQRGSLGMLQVFIELEDVVKSELEHLENQVEEDFDND